ncbi:MAG: hypothetical protein K2Y17_05165 [Qipengyuania sp.]|nr:hypothetical protein [Qipengyuania sp.]
MAELLVGCGSMDLSPKLLNRLASLGQALDNRQQLQVFDGGLVGFDCETESEVIANVAQGEARRSPIRSGAGQRAASDTWRRTARQGHNFGSEAHERAFGTELRILARHYGTLAFEDQHGLWAVVSSNPLGPGGPQINFLTGVIADRRVTPRAWAFERIGVRAKTMALKHTNFPDASVCAFVPEDRAWSPGEGLVAYADHLTIWAVKQLYREHIGSWPGPQFGFGALYRKLEFQPQEWCGCLSDKRYADCHQASDLLASDPPAHTEFRAAFGCDYSDRKTPGPVLEAARTRWKRMPTLHQVFSLRPAKIEFP